MSVRQYIGARYVTKIYENSLDQSSAEWESNVNYEPLVMVTYNNGSYLSKKEVPANIGNPAANADYWVQTGFYNGQIANLQAQINEIKAGFVTPEMFGAVGDGVTDDTTAIQEAIDSGVNNIVFSSKTYLISRINITDKTYLHLYGSGATLKGTGAESPMINLSGTDKYITIEDFIMTSDATTVSTYIGAVGSGSGQSLDDILIRRNIIHDLNVGISFNADMGGHLSGCIAEDNVIYNIIGTGAGQGYGIHCADGSDEPANCTIKNNLIDNCSRHSIYLARGRNYTVCDNLIKNHRKNVYDGNVRAALNISRSSNVIADGNIIDDFYDGAICITGDMNPGAGYPMAAYPADNITITNNQFLHENNTSAIFIGYLDPSADGISENVIIANNLFNNATAYSGVNIRYGKNVKITDNIFKNSWLVLLGDSINGSDNWEIINNMFDSGTTRCIEYFTNWATSTWNTLFQFNSTIGSVDMFNAHAVATNPNVSFIGTDKSGYSSSATFKTIYVNSTPM